MTTQDAKIKELEKQVSDLKEQLSKFIVVFNNHAHDYSVESCDPFVPSSTAETDPPSIPFEELPSEYKDDKLPSHVRELG